MLEYPHNTPYSLSLDALSLSVHPFHSVKDPAPVSPPPASDADADSPPSALSSSYSPHTYAHDHRRSVSYDSSVSPPTSAQGDDRHPHPRIAVDDAQFAYAAPPHAQHYFYDRRQSEPDAARYRGTAYAVAPPLSSSLPASTSFPHAAEPAPTPYSPRPSTSYAYGSNSASWAAAHHDTPSEDQDPFTTTPIHGAAQGLAITATSAALAHSGLALGHALAPKGGDAYFDDAGAWLEQGSARPDTGDSASGPLAQHAFAGHAADGAAAAKTEERGAAKGDKAADGGEGKAGPKGKSSKTYSFVALPGNTVKKRPRRRYDEIERLYQCK